MSKLADIAFAVWDFLFGDDSACKWTIIGGTALILLSAALPWGIGRWFVYAGLVLTFVAVGVRHFLRDQQAKFERERRLSFRLPNNGKPAAKEAEAPGDSKAP
jgi:hypothetical protein